MPFLSRIPNNAGFAGIVSVPVAEIEEESWDEVMNVNLKRVWMCMKYEIPAMLVTRLAARVSSG